MENTLWGIPNLDVYLVVAILIFFGLLETIAGYLRNSKRTSADWIQEVGSFFALSVLIKPSIVLCVLTLGHHLLGPLSNTMAEWNFILALIFYLLIDDFLQYWYHRFAHEHPFFWKLHRAHHQAEEMGFFVSYRNAGLYYILMPNIWWIGVITFLGGGKAVALGLILKQAVIISSHSRIKWDEVFYKNRLLNPFILILERIIITPAFHHAHHGKSKLDHASDPNGNFGNMFSIWDQLFGTALFTHRFPHSYGLQTKTVDHWTAAYLYPAVASMDEKSVLSRGFKHEITADNKPYDIKLLKDKSYLWCACGKSKSQPFCDGSHHGSKFKPVLYTSPKDQKVKLCNCKKTRSIPFCDNSHLSE